ncbi:acetyl-CoA synthetase-like protein [Annulohypoxylon truncatum]|uniref:acetyl-CoA synthetase-like protein n=1 Tax=Annulohypoxylon truncatum TaxID=327061 RepID=UPI002007D4FD|nr:acetyl-CoA synthetase-like protein [Annulohypoxylon truncatum]KAI1211894.1 acetyl-CoA synthetase-like protein [Annulohypoxylon truncatum]
MKSSFRPLTLHALHVPRLRYRSLRCVALHHRIHEQLEREIFTCQSIEKRAVQQRGIATSSLSYAEGPKEPPLITVTIPEHFRSVVSQHGDRPAAIFRVPTTDKSHGLKRGPGKITLTYQDLDIHSDVLAHSLRSLGVKKGERVALSLGNVAEHVIATYALFKLGAVLVPLNPTFNEKQLVTALSHLRVSVLIIGAVTDLAYKPCRGRSNYALLKALIPDLKKSSGQIESPSVPTLRSVIVADNTPWHPLPNFPPLQALSAITPFSSLLPSVDYHFRPSPALFPHPGPVVPDSPLSPDEIINIQFTSGTTSNPKAAMLSHANILNNGRLVADRMGLVPEDRIVCPPPLFHCFGCVLGLQATATTGAAILFPSPAFDPTATLLMVAEHAATGLHGVPTMFAAELELLQSPEFVERLREAAAKRSGTEDALFTGLRKGIAAGSSVPEPLMRQLNAKLGLEDLVICYGMTETSPVSCMTSPADPPAKRAGSVGRVMPHTAVKIVDRNDSARVLPRGECGELAVSGYLLMKQYFEDQARTDEVLIKEEETREGDEEEAEGRMWMLTGDEARMDEEGYVEITGRIKDLIIRGGENIHPLEIEEAIMRHELVREASVVGVPDEKYGEVVAAFVAVHKDVRTRTDRREPVYGPEEVVEESQKKALWKDKVKNWVEKHLSGHLVPKYVFFIDEFPKTASGKIQKFKLRELAKDLIDTEPSSGEGEPKAEAKN